MCDYHTTWRQEIEKEMEKHGEEFSDIERIAADEGTLDKPFDPSVEGGPFTIWTTHRVYFPACYDGLEWVASVPRHPCDERTGHVGG